MADTAKLKEALRQQERVLDHAVRVAESIDRKVQFLLGAALVVLGWGLLLVRGMIATPFLNGPPTVVLGFLATGTSTLVGALLMLLHGYVGFTGEPAGRTRHRTQR